jgi:hypothetical protein
VPTRSSTASFALKLAQTVSLRAASPVSAPAHLHVVVLRAAQLPLLFLLLDTRSARSYHAAGSSTLSSLLAPACELLQLRQLLHTAASCGLGSRNLHAAAPQHLRHQSLLLALRLLLFQRQSAAHAYASTPALQHLHQSSTPAPLRSPPAPARIQARQRRAAPLLCRWRRTVAHACAPSCVHLRACGRPAPAARLASAPRSRLRSPARRATAAAPLAHRPSRAPRLSPRPAWGRSPSALHRRPAPAPAAARRRLPGAAALCTAELSGGEGKEQGKIPWTEAPPAKEKGSARDKGTEEKGKRDFPRTYAQFQKTAGTCL